MNATVVKASWITIINKSSLLYADNKEIQRSILHCSKMQVHDATSPTSKTTSTFPTYQNLELLKQAHLSVSMLQKESK